MVPCSPLLCGTFCQEIDAVGAAIATGKQSGELKDVIMIDESRRVGELLGCMRTYCSFVYYAIVFS